MNGGIFDISFVLVADARHLLPGLAAVAAAIRAALVG
jgi:hypothetical protein